MAYVVGATLVALFHGSFVLFVAFGGLVVWRFPRLLWLHLPALAWAIWIVSGNVCPLTTIENQLRAAGGAPGYAGGFIEHYFMPLFGFAGLTESGLYWMSVCLLALNVAGYAVLLSRSSAKGWGATERIRPGRATAGTTCVHRTRSLLGPKR